MSEQLTQLAALEAELAELKRQMPKHTPRPSLLLRIEDLEDEIARRRTTEEGA